MRHTCSGPRWASQFPEKSKETQGKEWRNDLTHVLNMRTGTSMLAREALEAGKALLNCFAARSMGAWQALVGLARVNEQRHGSTRFSMKRTKRHCAYFAHGKKTTQRRKRRTQGQRVATAKSTVQIQRDCPFFCLYRICHKWDPCLISALAQHSSDT